MEKTAHSAQAMCCRSTLEAVVPLWIAGGKLCLPRRRRADAVSCRAPRTSRFEEPSKPSPGTRKGRVQVPTTTIAGCSFSASSP
jgi:hypothetical protein